ncbi:MAG: bifunctional glutamate N-acetyltransferase/amino-acid acetyltransferase ArgJ, partial [Chloroflexi bacterium]|nr:bifunctional glutamate N-acetyltransferase/amino-acid acetyltransferase ArgJ [Chloroflexota bacterium]
FTTNQVCAAPVKVCLSCVKKGTARAIVVNSGNANACTGAQGLKDALVMAGTAARAVAANGVSSPPTLSTLSEAEKHPRSHERGHRISAEQVLVASTGRIGVPMPMDNVARGILAAAKRLGTTPEHAAQVAEAIMTSDTRAKQIALEFKLDGQAVRIGGICKGAGMIQPGMSPDGRRPASTPLHATMLCFITTDAAVERRTLQAALTEAVAVSFNRITVDGDMSTNDTVLLLANGLAGNTAIAECGVRSADLRKSASAGRRARNLEVFQAALNHVCLELAKMIVRDGEGVSRFVTVRVSGARTFADADAAARAVANSALVKTSWCGGDPNWGRILDALGYSPARVVEEKVDLGYSLPGRKRILFALKQGRPTKTPFGALCRLVAGPEFDLHIHLNLGRAGAVLYAADLTEAYVDFNKGDVSDPAAMGG